MSSKKRYPTGISRMEDGRLRVRVTGIDPCTNKLREIDRILPAGSDEDDALNARKELRAEIKSGGHQQTGAKTLTEYAQSWLVRRLPHLPSKNSQQRYGETLGLHILPDLGDYLLTRLDKPTLERWMAKPRDASALHRQQKGKEHLPKRPYSGETIRGWWRIFKKVLRDATIDERLPFDPTIGVKPPPADVGTGDEDESNTLNSEELARLLFVCKMGYPQWYAFLFLGFSIGARPGELRPLRWKQDIDFANGKVVIQQSQRRDYRGPTKAKVARKLPLLPEVARVLKWHQDYLVSSGNPAASSGLVFPGMGYWRPWHKQGSKRAKLARQAAKSEFMSPSALDKPLLEMARDAGIERHITPKAMRRAFNNISREAGVSEALSRAVAGWSSPSVQEKYTYVDQEEKRAGLAKILSLWGGDDILPPARAPSRRTAGKKPGLDPQVDPQVDPPSGAFSDPLRLVKKVASAGKDRAGDGT